MKTEFAVQKSEYSHHLHKFLNLKLKPEERYLSYQRMQEIEADLAWNHQDQIQIIITTKNTWNGESAPPMTMEDIKNS